MPTVVTVEARCPEDKEVRVTILDDGIVTDSDVLDNGDIMVYTLLGMQEIFIKEPTKE